MIFKLLMLASSLLLNQSDVLVQQHNAKVYVYDVDSYIHDVPPKVRADLSWDVNQLESEILGMLNMNIIYDYIESEGLLNKEAFKTVVNENNSKELAIDDNVADSLDISPEVFKKNYRHYILKKNLYSELQSYLKNNIDADQVRNLAADRFKVNKSQYQVPEKRDIGMIKLPQETYSQEAVLTLIKDIIADDTETFFIQQAKAHSSDLTVKYNDGQLGQFHQPGFHYPFADKVFSASIGTVPALFEKDGSWYIVRVNKIIPSKTAQFSDFETKLAAKISEEIMERKFQNIINTYATDEIEVNKDLVSAIFSRYEVFQ